MKAFIQLTILSMIFSSFAFAEMEVDSKKIKKVATELGKLLVNARTFKVTPASPLEMMKDLALNQLEFEDFGYNAEIATEGDSSAWGLIKMSEAISWVANAEIFTRGEDGEEIENSPEGKKAAELVKSLYGTGVVFGAGPFGAVQCGGQYPALMMIDTKAGKIYTFETEESGC